MPQENENVFIAESQSLDVDEQKKNDILSVIESCNDLQDFIKKLKEENLIWYFIGPLRKDENITGQINLKWEKEFQKFEQSIDATHKELKSSLPGQNFLVYPTKDNDFKIRFENEEKSIEISNILRASSEGKVYNISLGKDSQITATKKGSERHYDFTGSSSCEMTINWQAKDSEGNSINCSMTVKLDSGGIQSVIGEPKFGGITSSEEVLKLVGQNKEVFINRKTLYQAFTDMSRSVDDQQVPAEEIFTKDPHISPQSPTPSSSGYSSPSTPSSRRSSISTSSEFSDEDEIFEDDMSGDEEEYEQEGLKDEVEELEEEKETFAKYFAVQAKQLEDLRLERDSLRDKVNEQQRAIFERGQRIKEQEEELQDKNDVIKNLNDQLKDKEGETNEANKELQRKLKQSEANLTVLKEKNANLENDLKKIVEGLNDDHKKQLAEQLLEREEKLTDAISQLNEEQLNNQELARELNQLQKKIETLELASQQPNISEKSLADEMSKGDARKGEEIKQKDLEIEKLKEDLKQLQEENKQLKQEVTKNAGVDASSSTDQRETKKVEVQTDMQMNDFHDLYNEKGEYVKTEFSNPNAVPAQDPEKSPPLPKG
ncbi:hypothetical protein HCR16_03655 [Wolbachia pipientis]|uniref:hypothetical protein n=1 Tax=Wolbachia pipientis TaxID=955 RepID=UPI0015FB0E07|nr:hypothetical protein [Wolbachia pipientis]MBA8770211.1 hypothetical protein [Wolbachia pipientis]